MVRVWVRLYTGLGVRVLTRIAEQTRVCVCDTRIESLKC